MLSRAKLYNRGKSVTARLDQGQGLHVPPHLTLHSNKNATDNSLFNSHGDGINERVFVLQYNHNIIDINGLVTTVI